MTSPRKPKLFSVQVGAEGAHVTLYVRRENGPYWLRWHVPATGSRKKHWAYKALKHTDLNIAMATARQIAAALLSSTLAEARGRATVADVLAIYAADVAAHQKGDGPKECKRRAALWTAFLDGARFVDTIDFPTIDRFVRERRAGRITIPGGKYTLKAEVTNRAIGADIEYLRAALNHATRVTRSSGARLLDRNPIHGYQLPKNKVQNRPVASYDRYLAVVKHADRIDPQRLFRGFMGSLKGWAGVCRRSARYGPLTSI